MPNVIHLSARESVDLSKVERIDIQTGGVLVNAAQAPGGPVELAAGTSYDASEVHGPITVTGPGRIKYWLEGEPLPVAEKPVRGDSGGSGGSYESRTVKELRALAAKRGLTGYSKLNKTALIAALRKGG